MTVHKRVGHGIQIRELIVTVMTVDKREVITVSKGKVITVSKGKERSQIRELIVTVTTVD